MSSLSLPPEFLAPLSHGYTTSVEQNSRNFARQIQRLQAELPDSLEWDNLKSMTKFQLSVRLLNVLETLDAILDPPDLKAHATSILTCEYHLYELNHMHDLFHHPILHHWVTAYAAGQQKIEAFEDWVRASLRDGQTPAQILGLFEQYVDITPTNKEIPARAMRAYEQWKDPTATIVGFPATVLEDIEELAVQKAREQIPIIKARLQIIFMCLTAPGVFQGLSKYKERTYEKVELQSPHLLVERSRDARLGPFDLAPFVRMLRWQRLPLSTVLENRFPDDKNDLAIDREAGSFFVEEEGQNKRYDMSGLVCGWESRIAGLDTQSGSPQDMLGQFPAEQPQAVFSSHSIPLTPSFGADPVDTTLDKGKSVIASIFPITPRSTPRAIEQALQADLEETTHALTRLPLDLASLNLLTDVLTNKTLTTAGADASTVVREYVQHCLRIIERLGSPGSETQEGVDSLELLSNMSGGREDQTRAVKLLVMFIKNLLMKGLLPVQELTFDLEEICVRYLWIKEVREFRAFLDGGEMINTSAAPQTGG